MTKTKKVGFKDLWRMPKKLDLFIVFLAVLPYMIWSTLKGEEVEFVVEWDGKGKKEVSS